MPSTVPIARSNSANNGRRFVRSRPYELTFWPSSVISTTPSAARRSTSRTISSKGREISLPRTDGTMQKAQRLSQPIWIVTHAAYGTSRRTGRADGNASSSSGSVASKISVIGPARRACVDEHRRPVDVVRAEHDVDVRGPLADEVAILLGEAAGHHDLQIGAALLTDFRCPRLPYNLLSAFSRMQHVLRTTTSASSRPAAALHAVCLEQARDALGVVLVHLAPVGAEQILAGHPGSG